MSKILFYILLLFCCVSCCDIDREITYSYADMTVTRIDRSGRTDFYYSSSKKQDAGCIWITYSGFSDSWFQGFLEFDTINSRVTIYGTCFEGKNLDTAYFKISEFDTAKSYYQRPIVKRNKTIYVTDSTYGVTPLTLQQIEKANTSPNWYEITLAGEEWRNEKNNATQVRRNEVKK